MSTIYDKFGVRPIINVSGASTRVGGALMPAEVIESMREAATESVSMSELQGAASRYISEVTGAEAGYVTSGASAGLTLGTAAIIAGCDLGKIESLPRTDGFKNQLIISREHRNGYDHAARLAGAILVEVGMNEITANAGVRRTEAWEYEAAINDSTVGIYYSQGPDSHPPLEDVINVAKKNNLPIIVDAAGELPPKENLRRFIDMGADLVAFSGGKSLRGPQSTGILCGKKHLITSVALQNLDKDEFFEIWNPPSDLIPKDTLPGIPRHGIGRGFKVSKENVIGLLTALKLFVEDAYVSTYGEQRQFLEYISSSIDDETINTKIHEPIEGSPILTISINLNLHKKSAFDISNELKNGSPGIFVQEVGLEQGVITIHPLNLNEERTKLVTERILKVIQ